MHQVSIRETKEEGKHSVVVSSESSTLLPDLDISELVSLRNAIQTYLSLHNGGTPAGTTPYHSQYL